MPNVSRARGNALAAIVRASFAGELGNAHLDKRRFRDFCEISSGSVSGIVTAPRAVVSSVYAASPTGRARFFFHGARESGPSPDILLLA